MSAIIAVQLGTNEQLLVIVCEKVVPGVGGAAARVDAVGQLAGKGLGVDPVAMHELVLLQDVSAKEFNLFVNLTHKSLLGSAFGLSPSGLVGLHCCTAFEIISNYNGSSTKKFLET